MNQHRIQKGNPHKLALNQHVFPKRSIERFCNDQGAVNICYFSNVQPFKCFFVKPTSQLFCAYRAWDHKTETIVFKKIEDDFQKLADDIISKNSYIISTADNYIINRFYALWGLRHHYKYNFIHDIQFPGANNQGFSKDEQEGLEKAGVIGIGSDGIISGRMMVGSDIQTLIGDNCWAMKNFKWHILISKNAHFIVPDNFIGFLTIPINQNICFQIKTNLLGPEINHVNDEYVVLFNEFAVNNSKSYFFAQDFAKCPNFNTQLQKFGEAYCDRA